MFFFFLGTNKLVGDSCNSVTDCIDYTVCTIPNGAASAQTMCQCMSGYFYNVATSSCGILKNYFTFNITINFI